MKVLMYYSYGNKIGGPLTYINTIIDSDLKNSHEFVTCYQNKAPGGLDFKLLRDMVKKIKSEKPDLVHIHGAQSEGFYGVLAAKLAGNFKTVMTVHGFAFDDSNCTGIKQFLYKRIIEPISLRLSDGVYCVCEFASKRKIVQRNAGKRNFGYIYNPVPCLRVSKSREDIRNQLGFSKDDVVLVTCGRVTRDKGFPLATQIIKDLQNKNIQNYRFLVLGDGPYLKTLKQELSEEIKQNRVVLLGATSNVADYLNASDVFLFPSYHENLSIALLEACASSLPCVVSNVGGNSEIVKDGETGFVINEFSKEKYLDALLQLIDNDDLRTKMGKSSNEYVNNTFSLAEMCKKINEVYLNVYSKKKPS